MKKISDFWWIAGLRGLILLLLAFFVFRHPANALLGLAIYIGISLLFTGLAEIIIAFAYKNSNSNWGRALAVGCIDLVFGLILMSNPAITAATLPFIVGFWIIVQGVMTFVDSFDLKKLGYSNWWFGLVSGAISVLIGYFITSNLFVGIFVITIWMGIAFLIAGIVNIAIALRLRSLEKQIS